MNIEHDSRDCTPRECVWLMMIARAKDPQHYQPLIEYWRKRLIQTECQAAAPVSAN